MKTFVVLLFLCIGDLSFALGYQCTKEVTSTKTELATVSTWPLLYIMIDTRECSGTACSIVNTERIANGTDEICGQTVNIARDCKVVEKSRADGTGTIDVTCSEGTGLSVDVKSGGAGSISCTWRGVVRNVWNIGTCIIP